MWYVEVIFRRISIQQRKFQLNSLVGKSLKSGIFIRGFVVRALDQRSFLFNYKFSSLWSRKHVRSSGKVTADKIADSLIAVKAPLLYWKNNRVKLVQILCLFALRTQLGRPTFDSIVVPHLCTVFVLVIRLESLLFIRICTYDMAQCVTLPVCPVCKVCFNLTFILVL